MTTPGATDHLEPLPYRHAVTCWKLTPEMKEYSQDLFDVKATFPQA
jgi:hypothetical protein